jgi:hypothetical protein
MDMQEQTGEEGDALSEQERSDALCDPYGQRLPRQAS